VPNALRKFWNQLPASAATIFGHVGSLVVGILAAFVLHYVLYRIGLPSKPFIYVAF
jgi:hypothetical protein